MRLYKDMSESELRSTKEWAYSEIDWVKSDMKRCMDQPYIGDGDVDQMRELISKYDRFQQMIVDINVEYYSRTDKR